MVWLPFFKTMGSLFLTFKAYSGRLATLHDVDLFVAKMNRISTHKVGTAKRKKLKELQISSK